MVFGTLAQGVVTGFVHCIPSLRDCPHHHRFDCRFTILSSFDGFRLAAGFRRLVPVSNCSICHPRISQIACAAVQTCAKLLASSDVYCVPKNLFPSFGTPWGAAI